MKNVTITLEEEVARWARIKAAERDTSLSRLVGEMLKERMRREEDYEAAMKAFLAVEPVRLRRTGEKLPKRDQIYDRKVFRR